MRPLARLAALLAVATTLSCADMPTAPREILTVTGQITDRDGAAISQAYVYFYSLDPRDRPDPGPILAAPRTAKIDAATTTDAQGRFRILIPRGPYLVGIRAEDGYPYVEISVEVAPGHTSVDYRFSGVRVTGTVSGPDNVTIVSGGVTAYPRGFAGRMVHGDLFSGRYSLLLPPGTYEFVASTIGTVGLPTVARTVAIARDTTLDFDLDGELVSGIVRGPGGTPLERIRVTAHPGLDGFGVAIFSQADGTYRMYVPQGAYTFTLEPWDYSARYIASREAGSVGITGPRTIDFDMSGPVWNGTVRRASDSTVVSGYGVTAVELRGRYSWEFWAETTTDAEGEFRLVLAPQRYYTLFVEDSVSMPPVGTFAATDTTFDIYVNAPVTAGASTSKRFTPTPPVGQDAPASAAADPRSLRRSSRITE